MKTHPAADLFPMLPDDELQALAADIKANGLIHPIVTDAEGQLLDGRNRLAACKLAGIEPTIEKLNGQDPRAYIVSANLNRRNLSKGQQAMLLAMIYPEAEKGGRGKKSQARNQAETSQFSNRRLNQAQSVLRHSRELAEAVLKGSTSLDEALLTMREQQIENQEKLVCSMDDIMDEEIDRILQKSVYTVPPNAEGAARAIGTAYARLQANLVEQAHALKAVKDASPSDKWLPWVQENGLDEHRCLRLIEISDCQA